MMSDYGQQGVDNIRLGDRFLTLRDTNALHSAALSFIQGQLLSLSATERQKTIVCTHFWPTLRPWTGPAGEHEVEWYHLNGSDLDALIADCGPKLWLCGHAHTSHQVTIGTTQVCSNPRAGDGPGNLNPDFLESYVVEL
jgi:Icc-related predicted phosphoesterase